MPLVGLWAPARQLAAWLLALLHVFLPSVLSGHWFLRRDVVQSEAWEAHSPTASQGDWREGVVRSEVGGLQVASLFRKSTASCDELAVVACGVAIVAGEARARVHCVRSVHEHFVKTMVGCVRKVPEYFARTEVRECCSAAGQRGG